MLLDIPEIITQPLISDLTQQKKVNFAVIRLDLIHPTIGGNKYFKLLYNLQEAQKNHFSTLLTFGGAFSNHIYATAAVGELFHFKTIGIIRGEETLPLNPTLQFAQDKGMELHYWDRTTYRKKEEPTFVQQLYQTFGDFYWIPEGGSNVWAVKGVAELVKNLKMDWDYLVTPCGTGGTLAGLIAGAKGKGRLLGISVLKGIDELTPHIQQLLSAYHTKFNWGFPLFQNWEVITGYHFGGYAKATPQLMQYIQDFQTKYSIPLEKIYSGKMFWAVEDLLSKDYFPPHTNVLLLHTGGIR